MLLFSASSRVGVTGAFGLASGYLDGYIFVLKKNGL